MLSLQRVGATPWMQRGGCLIAAEYLRFVWRTNRFVTDPQDFYERVRPQRPSIIAMWHGQHFMMPCVKRAEHRMQALIESIRASGRHGRDVRRKGGATAFKAMLDALNEGYVMALTADVPKVARVAGRGIVQLAGVSGRPIYPVAVATSRRIELDSWDRSVINLPFGRGAVAFGDPIRVPPDADDAALEATRRTVEPGLNATTERAYAIADQS